MSTNHASPPVVKRFWIRNLTAEEFSTLIATFGGWGLDGMDVQIYGFAIPTLVAMWKITNTEAGLLATTTWPPGLAPTCYIAGPAAFVDTITGLLITAGHRPSQLRTE